MECAHKTIYTCIIFRILLIHQLLSHAKNFLKSFTAVMELRTVRTTVQNSNEYVNIDKYIL